LDFLKKVTWPKILIGTRNGDIIESSFILDQKKAGSLSTSNNISRVGNQSRIINQDTINSDESSDEEE
jgi:hypothetical protein